MQPCHIDMYDVPMDFRAIHWITETRQLTVDNLVIRFTQNCLKLSPKSI